MPWTSPAPTPTPRRKNFLNRAWNPYLQTFVLFDLSKISIMRKIHRIWLKKITFEVLGQRTQSCLKSKCHRDLATYHHTFSFSFLWTLQPLFGYLLFALVLYLSFYWHIMIFFSVMLLPFSSDFLLCLHQPPTLLPFFSSLLGSLSHH